MSSLADMIDSPTVFVQIWVGEAGCNSECLHEGINAHASCLKFFRSFAGEGLERERFAEHAMQSYQAGVGFAGAKANLESLNRRVPTPATLVA